MQPDERDAGYLLDMLRHARGAAQTVAGRTFEQYVTDENLRLAVERRIEIIGEAAGRVSPACREAHPEIPWRKIIAQRNILGHGQRARAHRPSRASCSVRRRRAVVERSLSFRVVFPPGAPWRD